MSEDASAGRLYADVVADVSGFRKDAEKKLKTALAGLKAKAKVEVQFSRAQARAALNATLREVARDEKLKAVKAPVAFDANQVRRALQRALREAAKAETPPTVKVKVEVDDRQAQRQLDRLSRDKRVTVDTRANTKGAEDDIDKTRRRAKANPIEVALRIPTNALSQVGAAISGLASFPAIASGIAVAAGAIANLTGGLFALTASASQAVGVLAAIPNAVGVAAQGIAALMLGFSGIGEAVKAMGKAQQQAGTQAAKSSGQQVAAAQAVKDAQERVARAQEAAAERVAQARQNLARVQVAAAERANEAERRVADTQAEGARRIVDAQQKVADAHRDVQRAVEDLKQATEDATERAQDLALQLAGAALDEEGAVLAVERAKKRLEEIMQPGAVVSDLDKREADLAYRQALQRLAEIRESNEDLAKEKSELDRTGIQGSKEVVAAQERVNEAIRSEQEARADLALTQQKVARDIADAQYELAKTQRDNAQSIADAQRELVKAQRDGAREVADAQKALARAMAAPAKAAGTTTAAVTALNTAMNNLSPAGQRFARFIKDTLEPRFKQLRFAVQTALLPPLQKAIVKAMPLLDVIEKGLVGTSKRIGSLAINLATLVSGPAFKKDVGSIMASNNRALTNFGKAGLALVDILRRVAVVAGPVLLEPFAKWTRQVLEAANASDKLTKSNIRDFLEKARKTAKKLGGIIADVSAALYNLGRAARPAGDTLLDSLASAAESLRRWTADPKNQKRIEDFFTNTVPVIKQFGDLFNRVVQLFFRLGEITGGGTLDGLFWVLNRILDVLQGITNLPGGGAILTTILTLAGVGLGLGLVAKAIGGIVGNLAKLSKYTGVTKLFSALTKFGKDDTLGKGGSTGKGPLGKLADEADDMGKAIDRELPKDKKKSDAVKDIGDKADVTKKKTGDLGRGVDDLGEKAKTSAAKSKGLRGALSKVGGAAQTALGKVNDLIGIGPGKGGKGAAIAKTGGGLLALGAFLFSDEIANFVSGGAPKGSQQNALGQGVSGAATGGGAGAMFGPWGAAIGSLVGFLTGFTTSGGDPTKGVAEALIPGSNKAALLGPLGVMLDDALGKIKTFKVDASGILGGAWQAIVKQIPAAGGLGSFPGALGGVLGQGSAKFEALKAKVPTLLKAAWQGALGTLPNLSPLISGVGSRLGELGTAFTNAKNTAIARLREAWGTITSGAASGMTNAKNAISTRLSAIGTAFATAKATVTARLREAWSSILSTASTQLTAIKTAVGARLTAVAGLFTTAKNSVIARIRETMTDIGNRFRTGLEAVRSTASSILGKISTAFTTAKDAIGRAWDGVKDKAASPVRWIGQNVYNRGIKGVWDKVAGLVKMNPLPAFTGFASGGIYPGYTPGKDIGLAAVSGGEAIMRPEWTRAVGSNFVDLMNRLARTGGVRAVRAAMTGGFANGGIPIVGRYADGGIVGALGGLLGAFGLKAKDQFTEGLKNAANGVFKPLLAALSGAIGGAPWGDLLTKVPPLMVNGFLDFLSEKIEPKLGGDAAGVVGAAKKYLGRGDGTDGFGGANNNIFNRKWGFGAGTPWCANFVSTAISDAKAGKHYPGYPTAAVYGYYSRMTKVPGDTARPGDLGVYSGPTGHINIVEKNLGKGYFQTIGGNENAVVRRATRSGAYAILRPKFARGGVVDRKVFREQNLGFDHDKNDPLYRLLARLNPSVAQRVSTALAKAQWMQRDSGGPLYPGLNVVNNDTGSMEWVLTPEAVRLMGGPKAVQALNDRARIAAAGRTSRTTAARTGAPATTTAAVNVFPQPGQSEYEIGMVAARKVGTMLRHI